MKWLETMTKKYGLPTAGTYYYRVVLLPLGTYNKHTSEEIHSYHKRVRYGDFVLCEVLVCVCVCVCVAAACLHLLQNC